HPGDQRDLDDPACDLDRVRRGIVLDRAPSRMITAKMKGRTVMSKKLVIAASAAALLWSVPALADGELHIYNWGNYTNPKLIEKFEKQFNIKVTMDDYDSNETMLSKVRAGNSGYDIV